MPKEKKPKKPKTEEQVKNLREKEKEKRRKKRQAPYREQQSTQQLDVPQSSVRTIEFVDSPPSSSSSQGVLGNRFQDLRQLLDSKSSSGKRRVSYHPFERSDREDRHFVERPVRVFVERADNETATAGASTTGPSEGIASVIPSSKSAVFRRLGATIEQPTSAVETVTTTVVPTVTSAVILNVTQSVQPFESVQEDEFVLVVAEEEVTI